MIRAGLMALNGGNFDVSTMTDQELIAMGFAFDATGAASVRAAGKVNALLVEARRMAEAEKASDQRRVENNANVADTQQFDCYRKIESNKPGGEWDWQAQAPDGGAVQGRKK